MKLKEINSICSEKYQDALYEAQKSCGRGCFQSRGRWLKAIDKNGDVIQGECDTWEWLGNKVSFEQAKKAFEEGAYKIVIEGGVNFAISVRDFADGSYDPWVSEWSMTLFERQV